MPSGGNHTGNRSAKRLPQCQHTTDTPNTAHTTELVQLVTTIQPIQPALHATIEFQPTTVQLQPQP